MFELAEAVLCADGPVSSLVALSLCPAVRRGHGGLYDALAAGRIAAEPLQDALIATLPQGAPLLVAVDVTLSAAGCRVLAPAGALLCGVSL